MFTEMIINGQTSGPMGDVLSHCRWDPGLLRPYIGKNGRRYCTVNTGRMRYCEKTKQDVPVYAEASVDALQARGINSPVFNATSLRKSEWILLDQRLIREARKRLRAWADLAAANTYSGFNGMSKMILEHETQNDPGEALVDMDGLSEGRNDAPKFQLEGLPLPITHSDFWMSHRRLALSRNTGTPLDSNMGEAAGRRVMEMIEKTTIGTETGVTYGGGSATPTYGRASTVFGYTTFTSRLTKTNLTTPTGSNPEATVADVLAMRQQLYNANFFGPWVIYHSNDWDTYMDNDYARLGGANANMTLRDRLRKIDGIQDVKRLDFLTSTTNPFTLIMVQMTSDVCRAVIGMDLTTVQWESQGGMRLNFKVMCIMVPQLFATYGGYCGILHATTS